MLFIAAASIIYPLIAYYLLLTLAGIRYYLKFRASMILDDEHLPTVTILIPARNEELVIESTLRAIIQLDYPKEKLEVILLNDGSTDRTEEIGRRFEKEYSFIKVINVENGGRGKSYALNYGLKFANGDIIAVYDADNQPERTSLRMLVSMIDNKHPVVVGKVKTQNWDVNILTRFISMEFMYFQLISQGGRSKLFGNALIPGTNFVIKRSLLQEIGGWDENALAEDLELSFRIIEKGYHIAYNPQAISWEQEPEHWGTWFRQRVRWATGNVYTAKKYLKNITHLKSIFVKIDILTVVIMYYLFSFAVLLSDILFMYGIYQGIYLNAYFTIIVWAIVYSIYLFGIYSSLVLEREYRISYWVLALVMYYTYSQIWIVISLKGLDNLRRGVIKWYKTARTAILKTLYYPLFGKTVDEEMAKWGINFTFEGKILAREQRVKKIAEQLAIEEDVPIEDAQKIVSSILTNSNVVVVSSKKSKAIAIKLGLIPIDRREIYEK